MVRETPCTPASTECGAPVIYVGPVRARFHGDRVRMQQLTGPNGGSEMIEHKHFSLTIRENGKVIDERSIYDPFIHTTIIVPRGFRAAWQCLFGGIKFVLHVTGDGVAHRGVFQGVATAEAAPQNSFGVGVTGNLAAAAEKANTTAAPSGASR